MKEKKMFGNMVSNLWKNGLITRSSESDGRSDVTDSLDSPDKFRLP